MKMPLISRNIMSNKSKSSGNKNSKKNVTPTTNKNNKPLNPEKRSF